MTLADRPPESPSPGPGLLRIALVLLLLLLLAGAGVFLLLRPHLVFTNRLRAPVRVVVGDDPPSVVAPGASLRRPLARGRTMVTQWELVRPRSANDTPMGEEVRGSSVLRGPSGTVRVSALSRSADQDYFAPLITNASSHTLRIIGNPGLEGALDCGCAVRPGAERTFIGYYRLYRNSTVSARAANLAATFRELGPQVTSVDGSVGLRFEDKDLRAGAIR